MEVYQQPAQKAAYDNFIGNWIEMKNKEYDALRLRTHPYEFYMYFDL